MKVLLTGADGFLGWHSRIRLRALTEHEVVEVGRSNWSDLRPLARGVDAIVHVAGVNRATPAEVERGNIELAEAVAEAARGAGSAPRIVFANSIQAGNDSPYGIGKAMASEVLQAAANEIGSAYVDVRLPNLFGEHGRPRYNSFVATFVDCVIKGESPTIDDRGVALLHVQDAAESLLDGLTSEHKQLRPDGTDTTVQRVLDLLRDDLGLYSSGDIPPLPGKFETDMFNTLRAALFPNHYPIMLTAHSDNRGRLVETVRAHGGQGQTFVSTTRPGITRGDHFHLGKVERFVVLSGQARISLRKVFTDEVVSFDVSGDAPAVVDMPTMWVHNITNTGDAELTTLFWTQTLFDAAAPDTYWEPVTPAAAS
jgi:UDP-2-acetamido-2,6-beta-L-arabino-hexul-4-ose reductase